ncbi:MAG: carboxypeptidase-like regulatory domain-containing protein, partial [Terriglobia bacterium]
MICATVAIAQLPTATILGTVRDSTGAVIPAATVTVRNTETGLTRTGQSGADGSYRLAALPVGPYEVRAEQAGFRAEVRSGVTLTVGQEAVLNFALQVGAIEQTVEVTGEAPLVNTTSGMLGSLVNEQQVADLPLNGRNYLELSLLQPGVIQHQTGASNARFTGAWFSTNGAPPRSNYYILDGTPVGNVDGGTAATAAGTTLGVEGIREWRLMTNS